MNTTYTGFVDRMLCLVDGAVAPVWISEILHTPARLAPADIEGPLDALLARVPRLSARFRGRWVLEPTRAKEVVSALDVDDPVAEAEACFARGVDLERDPPFRITLLRSSAGTRVVFQLHHALGDGRSLMLLNRALWAIASGQSPEIPAPPAFTDAVALRAALSAARALPALRRPENRVLTRRATALRRDGDTVGRPILRTLRVPLGADKADASALFFGAVLAAVAAHGVARPDAPVRLRVPIDLRRELGLGHTFENACTALSIEIPSSALGDAPASLVPSRIADALRGGLHRATLLEVLAAGRFAPRATLRAHAAPDLLADIRANTLVTTYVGSVDRYLSTFPWPLDALQTQTSTWGANGFTLRGALHLHFTAFDGLVRPDNWSAFAEHAARYLRDRHGLSAEVIA